MNPSFTADEQAHAKALVEHNADVQRFAGTSQPTVTYQRPFITTCADVPGTIEQVQVQEPPHGDVEMLSWRCIDGVTESGVYKVNLSGTKEFAVEVDLRTSTIVAFEPTVKFGDMHRVAAAPHPNEGLPCKTND